MLANSSSKSRYFHLQKLEAHAEIMEGSAVVTLTQTFETGPAHGLLYSAKYQFPLPENAAVCAFEMRFQNGKVTRLATKERNKAEDAYFKASHAGRAVGLTGRCSDNTLRNLPGDQIIITKLTYVMDLANPECPDQIRLHLPLNPGHRGVLLGPAVQANRVSVTVNICMKAAIKSIASPSHPSVVTSFGGSRLQQEEEEEELPAYTPSGQTASYHSPDFLTKDFVLVITTATSPGFTCIAERHRSGSVAFLLSMTPTVKLPPLPAQEYIFLVDCSASMYGHRIATARKTLALLLHALPSEGTTFNIVSFGSWTTKMWPASRAYTQEAMLAAYRHVEQIKANHGGTDIGGAMDMVRNSRNRDVPTACFLLTDGEMFETSTLTINTVVQEIARSTEYEQEQQPRPPPLRIFTLGIGESVSSPLCQSIARVGNGLCLLATDTDTMLAKCARLVRISRLAPITDIAVDWGVGVGARHRTCLRLCAPHILEGHSRAPMEGMWTTRYALVDKWWLVVPKEVVVTYRVACIDDPIRVTIPVEELPHAKGMLKGSQMFLVHLLAVRDIIGRLEASMQNTNVLEIKKQVLPLAKKYRLMNRFTSIVAEEKKGRGLLATRDQLKAGSEHAAPRAGAAFPFAMGTLRNMLRTGTSSQLLKPNLDERDVRDSTLSKDPGKQRENKYTSSDNGDPSALKRQQFAEEYGYDPTNEDGYNVSQEEYGVSSRPRNGVAYSAVATAGWVQIERHTSEHHPEASGTVNNISTVINSASPAQGENLDGVDDEAVLLIRLQAFDGSFEDTPELRRVVGSAAGAMDDGLWREQLGGDVSGRVWATVLAVVYLQKSLTRQPDLLDALVEKAMSFVCRSVGADAEALSVALLERARTVIGR